MMDHRTCPQCHTDEHTKHVATRAMSMTFVCQNHSVPLTWTVRFGPEPRPIFDPRRLPAEAA